MPTADPSEPENDEPTDEQASSDAEAYEHPQRGIDRLNAEMSEHIERTGWDVGFLLPDPATGRAPRIDVETPNGGVHLDLGKPTAKLMHSYSRRETCGSGS